MAVLMKGTDVAAGMNDALLKGVRDLKSKGVEPTLAIIRVGAPAHL